MLGTCEGLQHLLGRLVAMPGTHKKQSKTGGTGVKSGRGGLRVLDVVHDSIITCPNRSK